MPRTCAATTSSTARRTCWTDGPIRIWATDDRVTSADVTIDLGRPAKFQVIRLREAIQFGQRIDAFEIERWQPEGWEPVAKATSIGPRRLIRLDAPMMAQRLRLRITQASASPALTRVRAVPEPGDWCRPPRVWCSCTGSLRARPAAGPAFAARRPASRGVRGGASGPAPSDDLPPATVIVPVKGDDEGLRENLAALASLDYPDYELIVAAQSADDIPRGVLPARAAWCFRRRRIRHVGESTEPAGGGSRGAQAERGLRVRRFRWPGERAGCVRW